MTSCPTPRTAAPRCPITNMPTLPVGPATVRQHALHSELPETVFGFCDVPTCDVVYVAGDGTLIGKADLRTRVGMKETEEPIPVCYCFDFTARQITDDLLEHGESRIRAHIQEQVRAGHCRCETANPSGHCCLGTVARVLNATRPPCSGRRA